MVGVKMNGNVLFLLKVEIIVTLPKGLESPKIQRIFEGMSPE